MNKTVRVLTATAAAALLGWRLYAVLSARNAQKASERGGASVAVTVTPVSRQTLRETRVLTGSLAPRSRVILAPKIAGRLERLACDVGDAVHPGDLIAELDSQEYRQQVEQARAEREVAAANVLDAESALEVTSNDYVRVGELRLQKVASEAEADQARARFLAARAKQAVMVAGVRQAEASLKASEVRLSYTRLTAAWDDPGEVRVIGERFADEGAMLRANDPIVSVLDVRTLTAVLTVVERDYPRIRVGQEAAVTTDAFPGETFRGTIRRKAPLLKEESRQARIELELPNADGRLAPGLFVRAAIELAVHADVPAVPASSIVQRDDIPGLFLAENGKARFVPVKTGLVEGPFAELLPPAPEGDVITLGQHLLQDGTPVRVTAAPGGRNEPRP